jgi:hypothetical protein
VLDAFVRTDPIIFGDGRLNILELIDKKNAARVGSPLLNARRLDKTTISQNLRRSGVSLTSIPSFGQRVVLAEKKSVNLGSELINQRDDLPQSIATAAVSACRATNLVSAGIDLIYDIATDSVFILELNSRAHIHAHSFPTKGKGSGNHVADGIIDFYFPESASYRRFPEMNFAFDSVQAALATSSIGSITLQKIPRRSVWKRLVLRADAAEMEHLLKIISSVCMSFGILELSQNVYSVNLFFSTLGFAKLRDLRSRSRLPVFPTEIDEKILC